MAGEAAGSGRAVLGPLRASCCPPSGHARVRSWAPQTQVCCPPRPRSAVPLGRVCCSRGVLSWKVHSPPASGLSLQLPLMPHSDSGLQRGLPTGGPGGEPVCPLVAMSLHQAGLVPSHLHGEGQATDGPPPHSCPLFCALGSKLLCLEE